MHAPSSAAVALYRGRAGNRTCAWLTPARIAVLAVFILLLIALRRLNPTLPLLPGSSGRLRLARTGDARRAVSAADVGAPTQSEAEDGHAHPDGELDSAQEESDTNTETSSKTSFGAWQLARQALGSWTAGTTEDTEDTESDLTSLTAASSAGSAVAESGDGAEAPSQLPARDWTVPRDPSWVPEQRPIAGERDLTSHVFEEATLHSENPPLPFEEMTSSPHEAAELNSRIVVAVALGVHSGGNNVAAGQINELPTFSTLLASFLPTAQPHHLYRFYFAYDHGDPVYDSSDLRAEMTKVFNQAFADENAKRWHPDGYVAGATMDASTLVATLHFVHCEYASKPSWAHSDAVMAAYKEGADYAFRTNDDTRCPTELDWVDRFILDLRSRKLPNFGMVGPGCDVGASWILTHDFTHRTHDIIFGYHYPRALPDWSSDDWITYTYGQYGLTNRRDDTKVVHTLIQTRYSPQSRPVRLIALNAELAKSIEVINAWLTSTHGIELPYEVKEVTCC